MEKQMTKILQLLVLGFLVLQCIRPFLKSKINRIVLSAN